MEAWGVLEFLIDEVGKHSAKIGAARALKIVEAGSMVVKYMSTLRNCGVVVPTMVIQDDRCAQAKGGSLPHQIRLTWQRFIPVFQMCFNRKLNRVPLIQIDGVVLFQA